MKRSIVKTLLLVCTSVALITACYPGGPEYIEDYDAVYTVKDPSFDFSDPSVTTYFLADTVMDISEPGQSPKPVGNQAAVLAEIAAQMDAMGYTRITDTTKVLTADFIVTTTVTRTNNYYYNYWYGWGGWYGWGWGGCCYYPPYATVSNVRTGSLLVDIIDTKSLDPNEEHLPIVWTGIMMGLYEGTSQNITNRAVNGIEQMFKQSQYLKR
jgi:hypothetical protein